MRPGFGAVADDITGATDLASALVAKGVPTVQVFGADAVRTDDLGSLTGDVAGAVVVALKSRNLPPAEAVDVSMKAFDGLRAHGVERVFSKYCSTFDSTSTGNIGPVADAFAERRVDGSVVVHCPAYPANGRTVYQGHLFVGDRLLSESGMERHPLTPMRDPDLVRVLGAQTSKPVGRLCLSTVRTGVDRVRRWLDDAASTGTGHVIADAIEDQDLDVLAAACDGLPVVAGGAAFGSAVGVRDVGSRPDADTVAPPPRGSAAVLAGSGSEATRRQIAHFARGRPTRLLDPFELAAGPDPIDEILDWARKQLDDGPILVAADSRPESVVRAREELGSQAARLLEDGLARIAIGLYEQGVRRFVVAGGETSGAVAAALRVERVQVGPPIATGVPWTVSLDPTVAVAFKSGNFGADDMFTTAFTICPGDGKWWV